MRCSGSGRFFRRKVRIQFMALRAEEFLRRKERLVLGDERGRCPARERALDDLVVIRRVEQYADGGLLGRLLRVAVECLDVERELPQIGKLELLGLQLEGDEALQATMEEDEVDREVLVAGLHWVLRAD